MKGMRVRFKKQFLRLSFARHHGHCRQTMMRIDTAAPQEDIVVAAEVRGSPAIGTRGVSACLCRQHGIAVFALSGACHSKPMFCNTVCYTLPRPAYSTSANDAHTSVMNSD